MLRLLVLTVTVAAAAAQYPGAGYFGYGAPLTYGAYGAHGAYGAYGAYGAAPAPVAYAAAPAPYTYSRRYRTQDELGQATFGHEELTQNHAAVRDSLGNVAGSYSYINPEGKVITAKYTAGIDGVKVESNALPVAPVDPSTPPVDTGVAPEPVQATAEVQAAAEEHLAAVAEAKAEQAAEQKERRKRALLLPSLYAGAAVAAAPAAAGYAAEKTEVILNPGHATAYRVDPVAPTLLLRKRRALLAAPGLYAAAPSLYAAAAAPAAAGYAAEKTEVILNPGHATAYRIDPLF